MHTPQRAHQYLAFTPARRRCGQAAAAASSPVAEDLWQPFCDKAWEAAHAFASWRDGWCIAGHGEVFVPPISSMFIREYRPADPVAVRRLKWHFGYLDQSNFSVLFMLRASPAGHGQLLVSSSTSKDIDALGSAQQFAWNLRYGDAVVMDNWCLHAVSDVTGPESRWVVVVFFGYL